MIFSWVRNCATDLPGTRLWKEVNSLRSNFISEKQNQLACNFGLKRSFEVFFKSRNEKEQ